MTELLGYAELKGAKLTHLAPVYEGGYVDRLSLKPLCRNMMSKAHPTKANLRALRGALEGATRNVDYTTQTLDEHVEKVVTKAKADVEAMVAYAQMHGGPLRVALGAGEDSEESYGAYARALGIGRDYDEQGTDEDGEVQ